MPCGRDGIYFCGRDGFTLVEEMGHTFLEEMGIYPYRIDEGYLCERDGMSVFFF